MVKHKLFIVNLKKEEAWLDAWNRRGYRLTQVRPATGRYKFERAAEGEFIPKVRIDVRTFRKMDEFQDYLELFKDCGWRHLYGTKTSGTQYFIQSRPDADGEIFSDGASRAGRYKRLSDLWLQLLCCYLPLLVVFQMTGAFDLNKMLHPKLLYLTPGLWELSGLSFWRAFLFETPFALGRGFAGVLFLLFTLLYAWFGFKALYWYRKEMKAA